MVRKIRRRGFWSLDISNAYSHPAGSVHREGDIMKRDKLIEITKLVEANAIKARDREAVLMHCTNPQARETALVEGGAANAYENVLEALKHNDLVFLRI